MAFLTRSLLINPSRYKFSTNSRLVEPEQNHAMEVASPRLLAAARPLEKKRWLKKEESCWSGGMVTVLFLYSTVDTFDVCTE